LDYDIGLRNIYGVISHLRAPLNFEQENLKQHSTFNDKNIILPTLAGHLYNLLAAHD
jgi:hypothetical protein